MADVGGRRRWSKMIVLGVGLLVLMGIAAFASVAYVPSAVATTETAESAVALVLRFSGFAFLLGAGTLMARRRRD